MNNNISTFDFSKLLNKSKITGQSLNEVAEFNQTGNKYFTTLSLSYKDEETGDIVTVKLPNEPLIALSQSKKIIETPTLNKGRKGTVKEYITTNDYQISIRGLCFDPDNMDLYPGIQVKEINDLADIDKPLDIVNNKFLELFGIRRLVVKSISFDEMQGKPGLQMYKIEAISDQDFYADQTELLSTRK